MKSAVAVATAALVAGACGSAEPSAQTGVPTSPTIAASTTVAPVTDTPVDSSESVEPSDQDSGVPTDALYRRADIPIAERVDDLLERMTLAEKIGQMTLVEKNSLATVDVTGMGLGALLSGGGGSPLENTPEAWAEMVRGFQDDALKSRLGIPLLYGIDAVHGHNNVHGAVIFPHNIGLGAADDPELMGRIGRITAAEMIATGIYWNYAPAVSVPRDIRWGRTYEGYSEDTARVSRLAAAYLRGLQGDDLADPGTVLGTPKHYVGDGGTAWGSSTTATYRIDQGVTEVDEAVLREVHLPPYAAVIDDGARSIMASYSSWGGEKMHAQDYLLNDVLKGELGFDGFVVSDWEAIDQISDVYYESVVAAFNAGIDMNMVPRNYRAFVTTLTDAVDSGDVTMARIDDAVRRILTVKFELGLFERPHGDDALLAQVGSDEHRAVAREAVARSQVLLKNDGDLLPLPIDLPRLLVAGRAADDIGRQSGGWTIEWQGQVGPITDGTSILEGIEATVSSSTEVVYDRDGRFEDLTKAGSETCIGVVGELPYAEGRGDRGQPALREPDLEVLAALTERCDELVVILVSGRPLLLGDLVDDWNALVAAWLPGTEGRGVADVVFGLEPFTGTLPYTWPATLDQIPVGHGDPPADPLFALGFGLTS